MEDIPRAFDTLGFRPLSDAMVNVSPLDHMTDDEVAAEYILSVVPVIGEQNIWSYWHTGWNSMPPWRQRTVIDWSRRRGRSKWVTRVLDNVPGSPWNFRRWTTEKLYPKAMFEDTMDDPRAGQHFSDAVRLIVILENGGIFMDPGTILYTDLDEMIWNNICNPKHATRVVTGMSAIDHGSDPVCQSIVAARRGDPWIRAWQTIYAELWTRSMSPEGKGDDPLLATFIQPRITDGSKKNVGDVTEKKLSDRNIYASSANRLAHIEDPDPSKMSGAAYWRNHVRIIDVDYFCAHLPRVCGDKYGIADADLFKRYCSIHMSGYYLNDVFIEEGDDEQRLTRRMFRFILDNALGFKPASGTQEAPGLARFWLKHPNSDQAPGTWAEYMRWARIHLIPDSSKKLLVPGTRRIPGNSRVYKVGLLEPITKDTPSFEMPRPGEKGTEPAEDVIMCAEDNTIWYP